MLSAHRNPPRATTRRGRPVTRLYVVYRKCNVYLGIWVHGLINALSGVLLLGLVSVPSP